MAGLQQVYAFAFQTYPAVQAPVHPSAGRVIYLHRGTGFQLADGHDVSVGTDGEAVVGIGGFSCRIIYDNVWYVLCRRRLALRRATGLFAVLRRVQAEGALHIAAEIGGRGEVEEVGYLYEGQVLVAQQAGDVERGVTVYPVVGRIAAHLL